MREGVSILMHAQLAFFRLRRVILISKTPLGRSLYFRSVGLSEVGGTCLGPIFLGRYNNKYAPKLIDLTSEIQGIRLQHVHGVTQVTFVFQLGDPLVECI
jgi:hypothetical protein